MSGNIKDESLIKDKTIDSTRTEQEPVSHATELVDFDGPEDPDNPLNRSTKSKWMIVALLSITTFATAFATLNLTPAAPQILSDFHSTDSYITILLVSIWELGEAIAPLIMAPLSETYGRVPVYHAANILFIIASICGAVSVDLGMLVTFRFLNGVASGAATLNAPVIGDLFAQEERGGALSAEALPAILAPVLGPVVGGYLTQAAGWRWSFWLNAIMLGVIEICFLIIFRKETNKVVILRRKAARLRKESGNEELRCAYDHDGNGSSDAKKSAEVFRHPRLLRTAIYQPLKMLIESEMLLLLAIYGALVYGYLYLITTTMTTMFETRYGFSEGSAGLTFIGMGVGTIIGAFLCAGTLDPYLKKQAEKGDGEMKPEYRLPPMVLGGFVIPIGLFLYGWTANFRIFWIAPIIGTSLVGFGLVLTVLPLTSYLVDAFKAHAASGMAVVLVIRSLAGTLLPLAAVPLYRNLGYGWGNSVLGFIALAFIPVPILFMRYGERIRQHSKYVVVD